MIDIGIHSLQVARGGRDEIADRCSPTDLLFLSLTGGAQAQIGARVPNWAISSPGPADGTVNMVTAERVGWTKIWAQAQAEKEAAAAEARKAAVAKRLAMGR